MIFRSLKLSFRVKRSWRNFWTVETWKRWLDF
jgi:hypothetical protein